MQAARDVLAKAWDACRLDAYKMKDPTTPARVLKINDTTLRDGEQAPGISFSENTKIALVEQLLELGINEIEVGIAATLHREQRYLSFLQRCSQKQNFGVWARANVNDISQAFNCGLGQIHISVPVSDFQLRHMGLSRQWVLKTVEQCIRHTYKYADSISIGAQDATRAVKSFLLDFSALLNAYGVKRLRFSDTVGIATPASVGGLTSFLKKQFNGNIEFHGHNDLGMATANCVSAVENGVDELSTTVNGIGERAGNAPLAEVCGAIQMALGKQTTVRLNAVHDVCQLVAEKTERPIPVDSPIIGENVFTHESGIHCHGQTKNNLMYQPFEAEKIGRKSRFVLGKHSGSSTVRAVLAERGIDISRTDAKSLLDAAHARSLTIDASNMLQLLSNSTNV